MNVLMISPGYPSEMPFFTRALAQMGANILGIGDQPEEHLPQVARDNMAAYLRVPSLLDEDEIIARARRWTSPVRIHRVETLWEPGVLVAARLREALGTPGMTLDQATSFRDKDKMKRVLSAAGIRTPRHERAANAEEFRRAAERIGFPFIVKPIAGAGSADTYRVDNASQMESVLLRLGHVAEVNVEEFIEGQEFTFDAVSVEGSIAYQSVSWYRPHPLIARTVEWISPQIVMLKNLESDELAGGREMGKAVLRALDFRSGFTHMEWFRKEGGEVVFSEIAARPPGARSVDVMNYASDIDLFSGWAEAVLYGRFSQFVERRYNAVIIFKRAQGQGRIVRIEGLERILSSFGEYVVSIDLLPVGAERRNWKHSLLSDGYIILRHPDLQKALEMADTVGTDLQIYAE